ncbi:MAG TPA: septum formation family protein [Agromyces sp.]|nr:septum formation family protein [Agromyces sp.]
MLTTRTLARTLALAAAVVVAGSLAGCAFIGDLLPAPQPQRDETTQEITESGDADVFALQVGDCLEMSEGAQVETVPVVPCSEPHTDEVYHDFEMEDGEFPGDDAANAAAEEGCLAAFEPFVGLPYDTSELYVAWYVPTKESWDGIDDRMVSCTISDPSGPVTGTLEGAAY